MKELADGDLRLEPQVVAHAEEMFRLLSDPAIYEFENESPESLEWLRTRFEKLETRLSGDGTEHWLNWVIRLADGRLAGYVQASVYPSGTADIAYILGSEHWGKGIASRAVTAMIRELVESYGVTRLWAVYKTPNFRSRKLLDRLGFVEAGEDERLAYDPEPDETLRTRAARA